MFDVKEAINSVTLATSIIQQRDKERSRRNGRYHLSYLYTTFKLIEQGAAEYCDMSQCHYSYKVILL